MKKKEPEVPWDAIKAWWFQSLVEVTENIREAEAARLAREKQKRLKEQGSVTF